MNFITYPRKGKRFPGVIRMSDKEKAFAWAAARSKWGGDVRVEDLYTSTLFRNGEIAGVRNLKRI